MEILVCRPLTNTSSYRVFLLVSILLDGILLPVCILANILDVHNQ